MEEELMHEELVDTLISADTADEFKAVANEISVALLARVSKQVTAEQLGLDRRAAHTLWRGPTWIAVEERSNSNLRYYGGFEYVDQEQVAVVGDYTFYFIGDSRVEGHWSQLED